MSQNQLLLVLHFTFLNPAVNFTASDPCEPHFLNGNMQWLIEVAACNWLHQLS